MFGMVMAIDNDIGWLWQLNYSELLSSYFIIFLNYYSTKMKVDDEYSSNVISRLFLYSYIGGFSDSMHKSILIFVTFLLDRFSMTS